MTVFDIANVIGRLMLTALVVYKLSLFRDNMIMPERAGLGMMGAGSFLTVPIIIDRADNPFNGWAISILTFGAVIFIAGRTWRDYRHAHSNHEQKVAAHDHLVKRGKL